MDKIIGERIKNKHLIIDTNILINSSRNWDKYFDFFDVLNNLNTKIVTDDSIRFEFLRSATTKKELLEKTNFLSKIKNVDLLITKENFEAAREISNIYVRNIKNSNRKISFVDCLIAGQMKKFNENKEQLFFATENNTDFPLIIFDRIYIHTIDLGDRISNIGIYIFNNDKFKKKKNSLLEIKEDDNKNIEVPF